MTGGGWSKDGLDRMHEILAGHVERGTAPGLVSLVSRRGEVHTDAIGTMAVGGGRPMQRDTIFRIASMTKPVTAVAALILVEECRLRLDDPVDELLPELADRRVLRRLDAELDDTEPARRPITLRDLLTFRLGFGQLMASPDAFPVLRAAADMHIGMGPPEPGSVPEPDEFMRRLGSLPLMHQPGEQWLYNTGSDVLGVLVARAADQSLESFMRERIFEPLGMGDTAFSVPPADVGRLATAYWTTPGTGELTLGDEPVGGQWSAPPRFPSGAGGLVSTVDDFHAFGRMLLDGGRGGGGRILSRSSVETMTTDQLTPQQKARSGLVDGYFDSHGWGFGVSVVTRRVSPAEPVGRYGWDGGLGTSWCNDPSDDLVVILLTQASWTSPQPPAVCIDCWTSAYAAIDD
jgi:CubicO group peptidase (beta-lactamase class C family)